MKYYAAMLFVLIAGIPYLAMLWSPTEKAPEISTDSETLTIMSPHRREEKAEYSRGFSEWMGRRHNRNVRVKWLDVGGTSKMLKELESRFATSSGSQGVDIMFGGGVMPYLTAMERGWLARVDVPSNVLSRIPESCAGSSVYDPGHRWHGVALSGFGIMYNKRVINRLGLRVPESWEDLGCPEYFSWIASGDPRSSGSVHMCYEIVLQALGFDEGWSLLTRICANVRGFGEGSGTVPREVMAGEVAAGMVIDHAAQTIIDTVGSDELGMSLPKRTTVIVPDAIGVIRDAGHAELAALFVEYSLSEEGQRLLFQPAGINGQRHALHRMPVLREMYGKGGITRPDPYDFPSGLRYSDSKGATRYAILNDLMGVWLIDSHEELRRAWSAAIEHGRPADALRLLCTAPVDEAQLKELAVKWSDSRFRQETMRRWASDAHKRYAAVQYMVK